MTENKQLQIAHAYRQLGESLLNLANLLMGESSNIENNFATIKQEPDVIQLTAEEFERLKKVKDPLKPKKPLTAYNLFVRDITPQIKGPGKNPVTSLTAEISNRWNDMSEEDKESYRARARELKEEYNVKMDEYKRMRRETPFDPLSVTPQKRGPYKKRKTQEGAVKLEPEELADEYHHDAKVKLEATDDENGFNIRSASPEVKQESTDDEETRRVFTSEDEREDTDESSGREAQQSSSEEEKPVVPKVPRKPKSKQPASPKKKRMNGDIKDSAKKPKKPKAK